MSSQSKLYSYLKLRRRIDRKILFNQKWSFKYFSRNRIEFFLITKNINSLWANERYLYFLLNNKIKKFAEENNLIKPGFDLKIETVNNCKLIPSWFNDLKSYDKRLRDHKAKLIIQGSYADSEITNYSDVDLIIFYHPYSESVLEIKSEIEIFLLEIDPLQHHGVFMIDFNTIGYYWQMDLPVNVLKKAKCFSNENYSLSIKGILDENVSSFYAVKNIINIIKSFREKDYRLIGLWEWKFFVSQLLLLPSLLSGSKGNYIYKRDSFDVVKQMYSCNAWYCIEKASNIRDLWPGHDLLKPYENYRSSVVEKPREDAIKAIDCLAISTADDTRFSKSLSALAKETEVLISDD